MEKYTFKAGIRKVTVKAGNMDDAKAKACAELDRRAKDSAPVGWDLICISHTETTRKVTTHNPAFAAPYGSGYKTPCISRGVRDVLLGTTSGLALSIMYNYSPAAVAQAADDYKRKLRNLANVARL